MSDETTTAIIPVSGDGSTGGPKLESMGTYTSEETGNVYEMFSTNGGPLLTTSQWKLYVAKLPDGQLGLMKISTDADSNDVLEKEAYMLSAMRVIAELLDDGAMTEGHRAPIYGAFFPNVLEVLPTADGRITVFMGYHKTIRAYQQLVPLPVLLVGGAKRVDLKTAVWMLGKSLKVMGFFHDTGMTLGMVHGSNLLMETTMHGVFVLDLSQADDDSATDEVQIREVVALTNIIWEAAGGSDVAEPPFDEAIMAQGQHDTYVAFLRNLMMGATDANAAYKGLYALADEIWSQVPVADDSGRMKRQFHPFTIYPR